jgi:FAD-dependent urate hydroxylase
LQTADHRFLITFEDGEQLTADAVVAAPGLASFPVIPEWVKQSLPDRRWSHTSRLVDFHRLAGARVLIVGGRQSAFESAALLAESGAAAVHVVHRHDPPAFETSHWGFVDELMDKTIRIAGWFRRLPSADRDAIARRFWEEGRLKLEPWLTPRLRDDIVQRWARTSIVACNALADGQIAVRLSTGQRLLVDHVVLATGYQPNLANINYLAGVLDRVEVIDGFPVLDEHFQTSVPGLFMTGFVATRDFGPFFGFVRGCPAAATIIVEALRENLTAAPPASRGRLAALAA